jgi:hypothetical protein
MTHSEYEIGDLVRIVCNDEFIKDVWVHRDSIGAIINKEPFDSLHGHHKYFIYTVSMGEVNEVFESGDLMLVSPGVTENRTVLL